MRNSLQSQWYVSHLFSSYIQYRLQTEGVHTSLMPRDLLFVQGLNNQDFIQTSEGTFAAIAYEFHSTFPVMSEREDEDIHE